MLSNFYKVREIFNHKIYSTIFINTKSPNPKKDCTFLSKSVSLANMEILNLKPIDIPNFALVSLCLVIEKLPSLSVNPVTKLASSICIGFLLSDVKLF